MRDRAWGEQFRRRRVELGLRQDELAALAGVGVRTVHAIEAGKSTVRLDVLSAVARALGLDLAVVSPAGSTSLLVTEFVDGDR
jgi:y4mF family transcriptional regulator